MNWGSEAHDTHPMRPVARLCVRYGPLLALVLAVGTVGVLIFQLRPQYSQRGLITNWSRRFDIDMSRQQVVRLCKLACIENPSWSYKDQADPGGERWSSVLLVTPVELGATNWVLYCVFEQDKVVAVLVRTANSRRFRPPDAPNDKLRVPAPSWIEDFLCGWVDEWRGDRRFYVGEAGHHTRPARWLRAEANQSSQADEIEAGIAINVGG